MSVAIAKHVISIPGYPYPDPNSFAYTESLVVSENVMEQGARSRVQVLDGGLATEIERRGFDIHVSLVYHTTKYYLAAVLQANFAL